MRIPYLQVAMEVVEQAAPDIAVELDCEEATIGWGLIKLFRWALGRCPDDAPPSVHAIVTGQSAAKLITKAACIPVEPERFVDACCAVHPDPILRRTPEGIRLCGLSRYDAAWGKSHKEEWPAWKAFLDGTGPDPRLPLPAPVPEPEPVRSESVPKAERKLSESVPNALPQTQTQTQTHMQKEEKETYVRAEPRNFVPTLPEKPDKPDSSWDANDFWAWAQAKRREAGLPTQKRHNERDLSAWWSQCLMQGVTPRALRRAFVAFGNDSYWASPERKPACPFGGFLTQWDRFIQPEEKTHAA